MRARQTISDKKKILKDQNAQTTARVVIVAYPLWVPFSSKRVVNLTKSRNGTYTPSVDSSYFAL